jgi:hypothetical protein
MPRGTKQSRKAIPRMAFLLGKKRKRGLDSASRCGDRIALATGDGADQEGEAGEQQGGGAGFRHGGGEQVHVAGVVSGVPEKIAKLLKATASDKVMVVGGVKATEMPDTAEAVAVPVLPEGMAKVKKSSKVLPLKVLLKAAVPDGSKTRLEVVAFAAPAPASKAEMATESVRLRMLLPF